MSGHWSHKTLTLALLSLLICFAACAGQGQKRVETSNSNVSTSHFVSGLKITQPARKATFHVGQQIDVNWSSTYALNPDSVQLLYDNQLIATVVEADTLYSVQAGNSVGVRNIKLQAYYSDGKSAVAVVPITVLPNNPKQTTYKVLATYPHNRASFTQGLYYKNGFLYEGTGQYGTSALLKVELNSGKIVTRIPIKDEYFGEGIAELNGQIFQLTWLNGLCLSYNAATMEPLKSYSYGSQGWGLTTDGKHLIMSDGSNMLTILNPNDFQQLCQIQVYDSKGAVEQLNELEYVDGLVWANIWQSDRVVAIDIATGAVVAEVDFSKLLTTAERKTLDDIDHVLNGIAYDKSRDVFYITGKCWPKMFEIQIGR